MPQVQKAQEHPDHPEGGRQYGKFQIDIYTDGLLKNALPIVTTDPNKLEAQAKEHLGITSYHYVAGGAGERATMVSYTVRYNNVMVYKADLFAGCQSSRI